MDMAVAHCRSRIFIITSFSSLLLRGSSSSVTCAHVCSSHLVREYQFFSLATWLLLLYIRVRVYLIPQHTENTSPNYSTRRQHTFFFRVLSRRQKSSLLCCDDDVNDGFFFSLLRAVFFSVCENVICSLQRAEERL